MNIKNMSHEHKEAFCLMTYATEDDTETEIIWNSRDGMTPFMIMNRAGTKQMIHVDWHLDRYVPDHVPKPGDRIFIDTTQEIMVKAATKRVEEYWEHPVYPMNQTFYTKEDAIKALAKFNQGDPAIITVGEQHGKP